ncbi:DUF6414 family protein [Marinobacterium stanieri]|uniref:Uncharacterized protein n=1 Tax=Marinobacterium stanieri TaxID=49186 RepID=A0A1N6Q3E0_9GAMM|nr:hypothetical protein [Marinobacterium stanieri]SIQ11204.1 hypothetical protein SAMN05421647_102232 [Marinobacterium stanieri]
MIKNFLYLDEDKMYSLSSQIFEGVTEYVLKEVAEEKEEGEQQKGPVGSGKILADAMISRGSSTEKKFLHDYSFTLFEKYLEEDNRVLSLSDDSVRLGDLESSMNDYSFIKIKSKAVFNDVNKITEMFSEFNKIGEALAHANIFEQQNILNQEIELLKQAGKQNMVKAKTAELKKLSNLSDRAKQMGLYHDQKFLDNLSLMTKYGFSDQFEVSQKLGDGLFTSCLKRNFLRENEDLLVKKYSRKTVRDVTVFGIVSQDLNDPRAEIDEKNDFDNLKQAILNLIEHVTNIEKSISGKQKNEIVIDPIAVYFDI